MRIKLTTLSTRIHTYYVHRCRYGMLYTITNQTFCGPLLKQQMQTLRNTQFTRLRPAN